METVKERPILFSSPMVQAILEDRKTQTRRVVKDVLEGEVLLPDPGAKLHLKHITEWWRGPRRHYHCPYGQAGDLLWVREGLREEPDGWVYDADKTPIEMDANDPRAPAMVSWAHHVERSFCVSIHMPRWASRITLEITDVRVERLQQISFKDCIAEGMHPIGPEHDPNLVWTEFERGWDKINGKRAPWASNPWVWAISFKRVS